MCWLNKSKIHKFNLFSKYKFIIFIQGYGYSSKEEPFLWDYIKAIFLYQSKFHRKVDSITGLIQEFFKGADHSVKIN